jgi:anti-anti-sigma factor
MSPSALSIRVLDLEDLTVVGLDGSFGADEAEHVGEVVDRALDRPGSTVVLDLSLLDHLAVEGSDTLARAARQAHERHGRVVVREPSPATRAVLDLTGASDEIEFTD